MKKFLKPTFLKILLFIIIFVILYLSWQYCRILFTPTFCPPKSAYLSSSSQPFTLSETIKLIPYSITGLSKLCGPASQAFVAALNIVFYGTIIIFVILSYLLSCGVVLFVAKLINRNIAKK